MNRFGSPSKRTITLCWPLHIRVTFKTGASTARPELHGTAWNSAGATIKRNREIQVLPTEDFPACPWRDWCNTNLRTDTLSTWLSDTSIRLSWQGELIQTDASWRHIKYFDAGRKFLQKSKYGTLESSEIQCFTIRKHNQTNKLIITNSHLSFQRLHTSLHSRPDTESSECGRNQVDILQANPNQSLLTYWPDHTAPVCSAVFDEMQKFGSRSLYHSNKDLLSISMQFGINFWNARCFRSRRTNTRHAD